jgi:hypothetical protein
LDTEQSCSESCWSRLGVGDPVLVVAEPRRPGRHVRDALEFALRLGLRVARDHVRRHAVLHGREAGPLAPGAHVEPLSRAGIAVVVLVELRTVARASSFHQLDTALSDRLPLLMRSMVAACLASVAG